MRETTMQPPVHRTTEPSRRVAANRAFLWGLTAGALIMALIAGLFLAATDDPWHGVPACTEQIADDHGVCHGEPR